ncbi:MAG: hypothetical protein CUN55_07190 [Phototrophicales bacterium]|nr:MAG: hypothetical protein CUN55_07190 [Phototrophicales bacterium]
MQQPPFRSRPRVVRPQELAQQAQQEEENIVEGIIPETQALVPTDEYSDPPRPPRRPRRRTRGLRIPRFSLFVLSIALMVGGVFFTLLNLGLIQGDATIWWPSVTLGGAILWMLGALLRRDSAAFVLGSGIAGVSISLLLDTQSIADFQETVVGILLMMLGMAVIVRGLLIRSASINR